MNPTTARMVRVAHVATCNAPWTDAHEQAVNERLAELPGCVLSIAHSAGITGTSDGVEHQFSTLITYTDWRKPGETEEESA